MTALLKFKIQAQSKKAESYYQWETRIVFPLKVPGPFSHINYILEELKGFCFIAIKFLWPTMTARQISTLTYEKSNCFFHSNFVFDYTI